MEDGLGTVVFVEVGRPVASAGVAMLGAARERIEPYGGREVAATGESLTALFGSPRQAVAFAVAVRGTLGGRDATLRMGVTAGEVQSGDAVQTATAIAAQAAGGEALVADVVRQLVGTMPGVRFTDRGRVRLRGIPERWRVFAASSADTPAALAPVLGREPELTAIETLLGRASEGHGGALVFEGEAGIGKTRLAAAAGARANTLGLAVAEGQADELERDRPGRILLGWAQRLGVFLDAPDTSIGLSGGDRGFAVVEALTDAVENVAARRPLLLIAEDLHWADELSLRGLAQVLRRLAPLPIAVVATMRPTPRPALLDRALQAGGADVRHLRLGPLDAAAVGGLAASLTGAAPGQRLAARLGGAAGNPLYVLELLRALDDEGAIHVEAGVAEVDDLSLPAGLRETVVRRLSSLDRGTGEMLRLASILGGEFSLTDLAAVAGRSVVEVASHLHEAVLAAIITGEGEALSFRHDLIREAVYETMPAPIRRDLHAAAGRALVAAGAPALQVARQLSLGARSGDLVSVDWLERAAREALAIDPAAAVELFDRALALAPEPWEGRARVEAALLEPLTAAGRVVEARARGEALLDWPLDDGERMAALRGLVAVLATAGDLAAATTVAEAAAALPVASEEEGHILRCVATNTAMLIGRPMDEAHQVTRAALAGAGRGQGRAVACWAHQTAALLACIEGRYDDAYAAARTSRQLLDAQWTAGFGVLIPHSWEGTTLLFLDRLEEALTAYGTARQRAERSGDVPLTLLVHAGRAGIHFVAGNWSDAAAEIEAGRGLAEETGARAMSLIYHALEARMALARGDLAAAETYLAEGDRVIAAGSHLYGVDLLLWTRALLLELRGEAAAALGLLAATWQQLAHIRFFVQYRGWVPDLVRLARMTGDLELARSVVGEVEAVAERSTSPGAKAVALRCRGLLDDDLEALAAALPLYRTSSRDVELAGCCAEAGQALLDRGDRSGAATLLHEAATLFARMGAASDVARVDALLRAAGVRRRRYGPAPATHGWESLSPTERTVVGLVTEGLSNPQIGARLYVSRRTVETHLAHVFRKLDVSSRAQLAALAATHDREDG